MLPFAWADLAARAATIEGTVTDEDGAPVEGAVVTAFDAWGEAGAATTDAQGGFVLERLPGTRYRLRAATPDGSLAAETWAPQAPDRCTSDVFELGDEDTLDVSVLLLPGATLTGRVLLPDGSPAAGAVVAATPELSAPRAVTAGADGAFELVGLPGQDVTIAFSHPDALLQYWGGAYDDDQATALLLESGRTTDLGEVTLKDGGVLAGTLYGPDGEPVPSGKVTASSGGVWVSAESDAEGRYELEHVPAGNVSLWAEGYLLTSSWYPDLDRPGERIPLDEGERLDGIDFQLELGAQVVGVVPGAPWPDDRKWRVRLTNDDGTVRHNAWLLEDGAWSINRLHGGDHTLWVDASEAGYLPDLLREPDGSERIIAVPAGGVVDLGLIEPPLAGEIEGLVTDTSGLPVPGAYVVATQAATGAEAVVYANEKGFYTLHGLAPGSWTVFAGFESPCPTGDLEWVTLWHPDTPNEVFGALVEVGAGDLVVWDPVLPQDFDRDGMDDRWEADNGLDPTRDDGGEDPDEDGFTNLEEYQLGTDPTDRARGGKGCGCDGAGGSAGLWLVGLAVLGPLRRRPGRGARRDRLDRP